MTELAYKFTRPGARSPFSGFMWPVGEWVEVEGEVRFEGGDGESDDAFEILGELGVFHSNDG